MSSHLKAVEIERDTIQDRMQVTVSQMNSDIHDLQKSIGLLLLPLPSGQSLDNMPGGLNRDFRMRADGAKNIEVSVKK